MTDYPALSTPLRVGPRTMRNRIVQAPLSVCYQDAAGHVTDRTVAHYARRARGGAGMVITENFAVDESGRQVPLQGMVSGKEFLPGLERLADGIRGDGALAVLQLVHAGRYAGPWDRYDARRRLAPSATPFELTPGRVVTPAEMTLVEMAGVVESFALATELAVLAGFDGVHVHGAQGFLLSEFLSPRINERTDTYGGDLQGRTGFVSDVVDAVVAAAAGRIVVGFHLLSDEAMPGGWTPADAAWLAKRLSGQGVDFISPVPTTFESLRARLTANPTRSPNAYDPSALATIATAAHVPVFLNGGLSDPSYAESLVAAGAGDAVMLGRAMLADPDWPVKVLSGRSAEIRRCGCTPPTCLSTQLTGTVCHTWPADAVRLGFLG